MRDVARMSLGDDRIDLGDVSAPGVTGVGAVRRVSAAAAAGSTTASSSAARHRTSAWTGSFVEALAGHGIAPVWRHGR